LWRRPSWPFLLLHSHHACIEHHAYAEASAAYRLLFKESVDTKVPTAKRKIIAIPS